MNNIELINGDCLEVMPTLEAHSVDMILADLPYGTTACSWDAAIPFEPLWAEYKRLIKPRGAIVLFGSQPFTTLLIASNLKWFKYCWVWRKSKVTGYLNAKKQPMRATEDVCVFYSEQCNFTPQMTPVKERFVSRSGGYSRLGRGYGAHDAISSSNGGLQHPFNVIEIPSESTKDHPTQKPTDLLAYLIRTYTNAGDTVLDNTMGSGSTLVACINTERNGIGIEMRRDYYEIAQKRISETRVQQRLPTMEGAA